MMSRFLILITQSFYLVNIIYSYKINTICKKNPYRTSTNLRAFFSSEVPVNRPDTKVTIEAPSMNSRQITASIIINSPIEDIWKIITDYDNLSDYVPNLTKSYSVPSPIGIKRIFQEGAQKIIGFEFKASLMMDMIEDTKYREIDKNRMINNSTQAPRDLGFKLVESTMFSAFQGSWKLNSMASSIPKSNLYKTLLVYSVYIRPKGPVPIIALEWRIREDIPVNLLSVKAAAEKFTSNRLKFNNKLQVKKSSNLIRNKDWDMDETLGQYISSNN